MGNLANRTRGARQGSLAYRTERALDLLSHANMLAKPLWFRMASCKPGSSNLASSNLALLRDVPKIDADVYGLLPVDVELDVPA